MLIREIITESYADELVSVVADLLSSLMADNIKEIDTEKFKQLLAKQGFITTDAELIQAIDQSGFSSSVDSNKIVPNNRLPADLQGDEQGVDVGSMATSQAMKDVKSGI